MLSVFINKLGWITFICLIQFKVIIGCDVFTPITTISTGQRIVSDTIDYGSNFCQGIWFMYQAFAYGKSSITSFQEQFLIYTMRGKKEETKFFISVYLEADYNKQQFNPGVMIFLNQNLYTWRFEVASNYVESIWHNIHICFNVHTPPIQVNLFESVQNKPETAQMQEGILPSIENAYEKVIQIGGDTNVILFNIKFVHPLLPNTNIIMTKFPGKIGNIVILNQDSNFLTSVPEYLAYLSSILPCDPPNPCSGLIIQFLIESIQQFDGQTLLKFATNYVNGKYTIAGWAKLNPLSQQIFMQLPPLTNVYYEQLMRVSLAEKYQDDSQIGDRIFLWKYAISKIPESNGLYIATYNMNFPDVSLYETTADDEWNETGEFYEFAWYYWHYFQFQHGVNDPNFNTVFSIYFQYDYSVITHKFYNRKQSDELSLHFSVGGDIFVLDKLLVGQVAHLKLTYCNTVDVPFQKTCHISCQECDGPEETNCIICPSYPVSKRKLLPSSTGVGKCACDKKFVNINGQQNCVAETDQFSYFYVEEIFNEDEKCSYSEFFVVGATKRFCLQCPGAITNEGYYCVDCLAKPKTWYLNPICTLDSLLYDITINSVYESRERLPTNYDYYLINEDKEALELCLGCKGEQIVTFSTIETHYYQNSLSRLIQIECKECYQYDGTQCTKVVKNCDSCNSSNQCKTCSYGFATDLQSKICSPCPKICPNCSIMSGIATCLSCFDRYALFNGECVQCGLNCQVCAQTTAESVTFVKCYKCIDFKKYYLSVDGQNCYKNEIPNCQIAVQKQIIDYADHPAINSFDIIFKPYEMNNIVYSTFCALCNAGYTNYENRAQCENWGSTYIQSIIKYEAVPTNPPSIIPLMSTTSQSLLTGNGQCTVPACLWCVPNYKVSKEYCFVCQAGYYADNLSGKCVSCPVDLNCRTCLHQYITAKDSWKQDIKPFYQFFLNTVEDYHQFIAFASVLSNTEYEVVCSSCPMDYVLYDQRCIKTCPVQCKKCKIIDYVNICIECTSTVQGQIQSSQKNSCIQCPYNCAFCVPQDQINLQAINPYFNPDYSSLTYYSNICLKQFSDLSYYYDTNLGLFVDCASPPCSKLVTFTLNVYCDSDQYADKLNTYSDLNKPSFQKKNMRFEDLFSADNASHFIYVHITRMFSLTNQIYILNQLMMLLKQQYFKYIQYIMGRSAQFQIMDFQYQILEKIYIRQGIQLQYYRYMQLEIYGDLNYEVEIINTLQIFGFNSISFFNIHFSSTTLSQQISLIYSEQIEVVFDTIKISGGSPQQIYFILQNPKTLTLKNIELNSVSINNYGSLFSCLYNITDITAIDIIIDAITITASTFNNTVLFEIPSYILQQTISITSISVGQGVLFIKSKLFSTFNSNILQIVSISIDQVSIANIKVQNSNLIDLQGFSTVTLNHITITSCNFETSNIFLLSRFSLINCVISQNILTSSKVFTNFGYSFTNSNTTNYIISNWQLSNNQYTFDKVFLHVIQLFASQTLTLSQIQLTNNKLILNEQNSNTEITAEQANLFIQCNTIRVTNVIIVRYEGYPEFTLIDSSVTTITNIEAHLDPNHYPQVLHSSSNCMKEMINEKQFSSIFFIFNFQKVSLESINFYMLIVLNKPIIYIKSQETIILKAQEKISLKNSKFQNITLLQNIVSEQQAIIQVISEQIQEILLDGLLFYANHQHSYVTDISHKSSATMHISSPLSNIQLLSSQLNENLVTNSINSAIIIRANQLIIENCYFNNNNQYNFENIRKYFIWGFDDSTIVYEEDFAQTYLIQSQGGSGQFSSNNLTIINATISNSQAQLGGGLYIETLGDGLIVIENVSFQHCNTVGKSDSSSYGGSLYISSSQSNLNLQITNSEFINSYSRIEGGAIYINPSSLLSVINFSNINVNESHSFLSSFLRISQTSSTALQVYIDNLSIINTQEGYLNFLSKIEKITETEMLNQFNNYLFFIEQGYFQIQNFIVSSFGYGIFKLQNLIEIEILSTLIKDVQLIVQQVFEIKLNQLQYSQLNMDSVQMSFVSIYSQESTSKMACSYFNAKKLQSKCQSFFSKTQTFLYSRTNSTYENAVAHCHLALISTQVNTDQSIIHIYLLQQQQLVSLNSLKFYKITCRNCIGLIKATDIIQTSDRSLELDLKNIYMEQNICGKVGCIIILQGSIDSSLQIINSKSRLLESQLTTSSIYNSTYTVMIEKSFFIQNTAQLSGVILIDKIQTLINECKFQNNVASGLGGAITFLDDFSEKFGLYNTLISENQATAGGGLYIYNYIINEPSLLNVLLSNNDAVIYGSDIAQDPYQITISLDKGATYLEKEQLVNNQSQITDQIIINPYKIIGQSQKVQYLMLPSGQEIQNYQYFDDANGDYIQYNLSLRIIPLNKQGDRIKKLSQTQCNISGRYLDLSSQEPINSFTQNYTNPVSVMFNDTSQDYNLDSLIVMFDPDLDSKYILQLSFQCNSIKIPNFSSKPPYQFLGYNFNYTLQLKVQTFQCQRGEQKKTEDGTCLLCDSGSDQFSVVAGERCSIKDSLTMEAVASAQIKLRSGYWRAYLSSLTVEYCLNLPINCEGGWFPGEKSCFSGHIGALCEQCDLYNTRGDGAFSTSTAYKCGSCNEVGSNAMKIIFISLWTIISIFMSVRGSVDSIDTLIKTQRLEKLGIASIQPKSGYDAVLIKVITNYFQIVGCVTTFQLQIPSAINTAFTSVGNPVETMSYSLDCLLITMSDITIIYFRMMWSLIMPLFYLTGFLILYGVAIIVGVAKNNLSILTTALIYMYIFMQPTLIGGFISLLSFRQIGGIYWVQGNVSYVYNTQQHFKWLGTFVIPSLLVLGCLIPLYMYLHLYKIKDDLNSVNNRKKLGYLYNEYRKETYYWEVIKIVQKGLMIMMLTFYQDLIVIKAALIFIIVFVYQLLTKTKKPYQFPQLNNIDNQSTLVCGTSIVIAMTIYSASTSNNQEIVWPFYILLIVINGYFCLLLVIEVIIAQVQKNMELIDKIRDKINAKYPDLVDKNKYYKILFENSNVRKARVIKNYRKIKNYLLRIVRNRQLYFEKQEEDCQIVDDINSLGQIEQNTAMQIPRSAKIYPEPTGNPMSDNLKKSQIKYPKTQATLLRISSNKELMDE